ncbi:extracellular solute-binding protein [Paenibacillus alkalitolerans]|uniref:extracellular solute-binding protein n=1 Tax=Paenibacillus alkalitolerans TaxID=2799335 RepID=UPI0018F6294F|nr:extracellular solute-binding protein [Paenibacillus alkalitolerans]
MKKTLTLILSMMLIAVTVLAGCSGSNSASESESGNTDNPAPAEEANKEPVPLTIFMAGDPEQDFSNNKFTKEIEEKLNIKLDLQVNGGEVIKDKRQLALTSGDYAHVFLLNWTDYILPAEQMKLGQQGVYVPLNDLIEEHAPNIKRLMEEIPYYKAGVTAPDGNIYALPGINECYHCSFGSKMWVNSEWLKAVNLEIPKTTEEFKEMLRAFKNNDLNGNKQNDEVPLSGFTGARVSAPLMNAFIFDKATGECGASSCFLMVNNGKVELTANKPEFKAGLEYIASLYADGLIDPGAFTQDFNGYRQLANREDVAILGVGVALHPYVFNPPSNPFNTQYVPIPPLTGPNGVSYTANGTGIPGGAFAITNKASKEQQIAAIKLADYMASEEGTVRMTFGEEGVNWENGGSGDIDLNGEQAKYKPIPKTPDESKALNNSWGEVGPFVKTKEFRASWAVDQDMMTPAGYELRLFKATQLYDGHQPKEMLPDGLFIDPNLVDEYGLLATNINKYVEESMIKFITGTSNFGSDWDSYVRGFEKLQLNRYLEIIQTAYDASK